MKKNKHIFIGILLCAEKEPSKQTIGAIVEVLRDLEHVDASLITIGTMDEEEILQALQEKMIVEPKNDPEFYRKVIVELNALYKALPEYMKVEGISQNIYEGYYIYQVYKRQKLTLKQKVMSVGTKLDSINQEIELFPPQWLNVIKKLSHEWNNKESCGN